MDILGANKVTIYSFADLSCWYRADSQLVLRASDKMEILLWITNRNNQWNFSQTVGSNDHV